MHVEWTVEMSVGITEIDDQHKELIRRSNDILNAVIAGKSIEEAERTIAFAQNYLACHFQTEEKYMMRYGYPQYVSHKARHTLYLMEFSGIKHSFQSGDPDSTLAHVSDKLIEPLIDHIKQEDKALGNYIYATKQKIAA
ncbi:bacteriohemerythrin [bacterium]|nr:bacteriohemerythrin [bacterium]